MSSRKARLFPHLTVRQNLLYGRWFAPAARAPRRARRRWSSCSASARCSTGGRRAVGRREAARRDRPGAARQPAPAADGRAAGLARRGAQGRDPALYRAAARRGRRADRLCQPRDRRGRAARDDRRAARGRPGRGRRAGRRGAGPPRPARPAAREWPAVPCCMYGWWAGARRWPDRPGPSCRRDRAGGAKIVHRPSGPARIDARDVVLALGPPLAGISIRNQLRATVVRLGRRPRAPPRSAWTSRGGATVGITTASARPCNSGRGRQVLALVESVALGPDAATPDGAVGWTGSPRHRT